MQHGIALTDEDRLPWLHAIKAWIDARVAAGEPGLVTCSALKRAYRDLLTGHRDAVRILYLHADKATIEQHLAKRTGHFMPPTLLDSQLQTLEEPAADEHPITVEVADTVDDTVQAILAELERK
jgi:carbohydrate kinase (thermoresistant glucokinase family)